MYKTLIATFFACGVLFCSAGCASSACGSAGNADTPRICDKTGKVCTMNGPGGINCDQTGHHCIQGAEKCTPASASATPICEKTGKPCTRSQNSQK